MTEPRDGRREDLRRWAIKMADEIYTDLYERAPEGRVIGAAEIDLARSRLVLRDAAVLLRVRDHRITARLVERALKELTL